MQAILISWWTYFSPNFFCKGIWYIKNEGELSIVEYLCLFIFTGIVFIILKLISFFVGRYLTDSLQGSQKNWNRLHIYMKNLLQIDRTSKKNTKEFLLNLIWFYFTGKSFVFFSTFRSILKKSNLEGVFEFLQPDPQLEQNLQPTRNFSGHLFYIYSGIYENSA